MVHKKVRVFWPVDSQWYIAIVMQYDIASGEHLLKYPDGDTEWVRIGEDHTTNTQYKEYYFRMQNGVGGGDDGTSRGTTEAAGNLTRLPSLNTGMSFALSAMSQSFGMPGMVGEESSERLKPGGGGGGSSSHSHQQQRLFQQLNLDRTASSMSSFGMYGGRQSSFGQPHHHPSHPHHHHASKDGRAPPFQLLSPNYTHSFSSKIGTVPSLEFGPPPPHPGVERKSSGPGGGGEHPSSHHHRQPHPYYHAGPPREDGRDGAPPPNWHAPPPPPPPHHHHPHHHQYSNEYYDGGRHNQMYGYPPPVQPVSSPSSSAADPQQDHNDNKSSSSPKSKSSSSKSSSSTKKESAKSRKAIPKAWTKAEDEYLLDQVLQMKHPLKWSVIAQSMSDFNSSREGDTPVRSGKQCRERVSYTLCT